jgi:putative peptidoglycan binding protein
MIRTSTLALGLTVALAADPLRAAEVTIPKGTYLELETVTAFNSDALKKADTFEARAAHALWIDDRLAIPQGATVTGEVKSVRSPSDGAKSAAIGLKFEKLSVAGKTYDIDGVLVSLKADERRKILEQQGKITTGRHVDVILIGLGTEADMKVDTLVGISGADRDDLADRWAKDGLGPGRVRVTPGTHLTMMFDKAVVVTASEGTLANGDRSITTAPATVKDIQKMLKGKGYYGGGASGELDQATRDAIARFQLDQKQIATGDPDAATLNALGVTPAKRRK